MPSIISAGTTSGTSLNLSGDTSGVLQLATNGSTTAITIDTSQNVGIGTASPAQKLDVNGGASSTYLKVTGQSRDAFFGQDGTGLGIIQAGNSPMYFNTNAAERMRITSGGALLVGTTTSIAPAAAKIETTFTGGTNYGVAIKNTSTTTGAAVIFIRDTGVGVGSIDLSTTGTSYNTTAAGQSTGAVLQNSGIAFPATQSASSDANTLDDYEEGTFTPSIIGSTTDGTASYSRRSGIYTKIGNRVFFTIAISWSSGTGTGNLVISGLPFTQDGAGFDLPYAVSENGDIAWSTNYMPTPIGIHNTTVIYLNASRVGASGSAVNTPYDAAGGFSMTGHYRVA